MLLVRWLIMLIVVSVPCDAAEKSFTVTGNSMIPALRPGEKVIVREVGPAGLKIGDLVAIRLEGRETPMVKRVAALPGDRISLGEGVLTVNGRKYEPPAYVDPVQWGLPLRQLERGGWVIPHGSLLVLGDNPEDSLDSRRLGLIPLERVVGRVEKVRGEDGLGL